MVLIFNAMQKKKTKANQKNQIGEKVIAMAIYLSLLIWNIIILGFGILTGEFFLDNASFFTDKLLFFKVLFLQILAGYLSFVALKESYVAYQQIKRTSSAESSLFSAVVYVIGLILKTLLAVIIVVAVFIVGGKLWQ